MPTAAIRRTSVEAWRTAVPARANPAAATTASGTSTGLRKRPPHSRPPPSAYWVASTPRVNRRHRRAAPARARLRSPVRRTGPARSTMGHAASSPVTKSVAWRQRPRPRTTRLRRAPTQRRPSRSGRRRDGNTPAARAGTPATSTSSDAPREMPVPPATSVCHAPVDAPRHEPAGGRHRSTAPTTPIPRAPLSMPRDGHEGDGRDRPGGYEPRRSTPAGGAERRPAHGGDERAGEQHALAAKERDGRERPRQEGCVSGEGRSAGPEQAHRGQTRPSRRARPPGRGPTPRSPLNSTGLRAASQNAVRRWPPTSSPARNQAATAAPTARAAAARAVRARDRAAG